MLVYLKKTTVVNRRERFTPTLSTETFIISEQADIKETIKGF
jgi:hypothetical protein